MMSQLSTSESAPASSAPTSPSPTTTSQELQARASLKEAFGSTTAEDDLEEGFIAAKIPNELKKLDSTDTFSKAEAAFDELIATEKSYIEGLHNLNRHFIMGLKAHCEIKQETPILTEEEIRKSFLNVTEIISLSSRLLSDLKSIRRKGSNLAEVGGVFVRYTPFFRIYSSYTESFDGSVSLLRHLKKTIPRLASFIRIREYCVGSKLDQLRTLPIQRIPRYLLLLREMGKHFPENSDTRKALHQAEEEVYRVAEQVNESIDMASARKEVFFLQETVFKNRVNLVTSSRYCVRYSLLSKMFQKRKLDSKRDYLFILFDDCLCYASMSRDLKSATLKHVLPLVNLQALDIDPGQEYQHAFLIKSSHKSIVVEAATQELKFGWINDLNIHAQILESNYATLTRTPPSGDELERIVIGTAPKQPKSILASTTLDPTTIAEKTAKLQTLATQPIVLLSEKQRDAMRAKVVKSSDESQVSKSIRDQLSIDLEI